RPLRKHGQYKTKRRSGRVAGLPQSRRHRASPDRSERGGVRRRAARCAGLHAGARPLRAVRGVRRTSAARDSHRALRDLAAAAAAAVLDRLCLSGRAGAGRGRRLRRRARHGLRAAAPAPGCAARHRSAARLSASPDEGAFAGARRSPLAGFAGAHPAAFSLQQPERGARADPPRSPARRARPGRLGGSVSHAHVGRAPVRAACRRDRAPRALCRPRAHAPGRAPAHHLGARRCARGLAAAAARAAAAAGERGLPRRRAGHRPRRGCRAHRAPRRARARAHRESLSRSRDAARRQPHGARQYPGTPAALFRRRSAHRHLGEGRALPRRNRDTLPGESAMSELKVFIADDEEPARERLKTLLGDLAVQVPTRVVVEAVERAAASGAQVVLLDIQMPGMGGLEVARHLARLEEPPRIIFVTAHDRHAVEAFELNALDYLLKPVRAERLADALRKAAVPASEQLAKAAEDAPREYLSVAERNRIMLVPVRDIVFLRAEQKYVTARARDREYLLEEPLVALEREFAVLFVRIHRNCLVARSALRGFERAPGSEDEPGWLVVLDGIDEKLPVSRRQWPTLRDLVT